MRPLKTPVATPANVCRPVAVGAVDLRGFTSADARPLQDHLSSLLRTSGFEVVNGADGASAARLTITLTDLFRHEKETATARRYTNIYFTVTVVDAWIIPILQATSLFDSDLELQAYVSIKDESSGNLLWRGVEDLILNEKPTGFFGPGDDEFGAVMLERAGQNLAVRLYDRLCASVRPPQVAGSSTRDE